jgi:DNA adenine methylase
MVTPPFGYFGGKRRIANEFWRRVRNPERYLEPFCGAAAVLLSRPHVGRNEIINDECGFVVNFWRALRAAPDEVARWADWPINETELHARHVWLLRQDLEAFHNRLYHDVDYYDARIAGYWVYGQSTWIGGGWCRPLTGTQRVPERRPDVVRARGVFARPNLHHCFEVLAERLKGVRVCCGDWARVCAPSVTESGGLTAVFLDPPYRSPRRRSNIYRKDSKEVALDAWRWALEKGRSERFRIALCGLEGDYEIPADWTCYAWRGYGYGGNKRNGHLERVYFSPHCL